MKKSMGILGILVYVLLGATARGDDSLIKNINEFIPSLPHKGYDPVSYDNILSTFNQNCKTEDCSYWAKFIKAKLWSLYESPTSCVLIKELTNNKKHPLYPVVLNKVFEYCTLSKSEKQSWSGQIEEYLKSKNPPLWLESSLKKTLISMGQRDLIISYVHASTNKKEKEKLLQDTLLIKSLPAVERVKFHKELIRIAPRFNKISDLKSIPEKLAAAQDALYANESSLTLKILSKVKGQNYDQSHKILEIIRNAQKMNQSKKEALKISEKIFKLDQGRYMASPSQASAKVYLNSGLLYARAQWTEHNSKSALLTLKSIEKSLKGKNSLADLYFLKARLAEEGGDVKLSLSNLENAGQELARLKTEKNPYLWNQGWLYYKNARISEALDIFKQIEAVETQEQGKRSQALFWQAQSLRKLNMEKQALIKFQQLIDEDPLGYYGFLAYNELGKKIPALPSDTNIAHPPASFDLNLFRWLTMTGEFTLAQSMLNEELPLKDGSTKDWQDVLPLYTEAQNYSVAFFKIAKLPTADRTRFMLKNISLLFPTPYLNIIQKSAEDTGLWSEYVLSIIRQESSFNPLSQSPADAIGLMQLLPDVAKKINKSVKKEDLFDPSINVSLGAHHLRSYYDHFDGNFILATAGYNASPDAVRNWVKSRYNSNAEIFIEDIPYEETRNYVKLVMRNLINYLRITTTEESIAFPQWCLNF